MAKIYLNFDHDAGYPAGDDIYYECLLCGESIPSVPSDHIGCRCGNVVVDVDYGRLSVGDLPHFKIYRKTNA